MRQRQRFDAVAPRPHPAARRRARPGGGAGGHDLDRRSPRLLRPGDAQAAAAKPAHHHADRSARASRATPPAPTGGPPSRTWSPSPWSRPKASCAAINRIAHRELFALVVGGQGLFGTLYSVTLRIGSLGARGRRGRRRRERRRCQHGGPRPLQLLVPPDALERFVGRARARCDEWRVGGRRASSVRQILPEEETFLRWARRQYAEVALRLAEPATSAARCATRSCAASSSTPPSPHGGSFPIALHAGRDARAGRRLLPAAARVPRGEAPHRSRREAGERLVPAPPQPVRPAGLRGALANSAA